MIQSYASAMHFHDKKFCYETLKKNSNLTVSGEGGLISEVVSLVKL